MLPSRTATAAAPARADVIEHPHMREAHVVTTGIRRLTIRPAVRTFADHPVEREAVSRRTVRAVAPGILRTAAQAVQRGEPYAVAASGAVDR